MFSENNRISGRQAFRLLTYDLLGLSTLLVPTVLAGLAGKDGIFCIVIGIVAALLYLGVLAVVAKDMNGDFSAYLEQKLGIVFGKAIQTGYLIYFVLLGGYTAYLFSNIVLQNLLREETFWLVLVLILLLAGYGLWGGIEGRARVYELLFWFIMVPLFFMLFSALDEINVDYWTPVAMTGAKGILAGGYYVFGCLALVFLVLFLCAYVPEKKTLLRAGRTALMVAGSIHVILYLILLGIFGSGALAHMDFPAVTLMSTVKISGGFLKRADAFMFAIWFFTLYALLNSAVFYGGTVLRNLTGLDKSRRKWKNPAVKERGTGIAVLALVFIFAGIFYQSREACDYYELFLWYIGTPFLILVPVILAVCILFDGKKKSMKKGAAMLCLLLSLGLLSGCNTAELEDRNFPIEAAVDDTEDFAEEWLDTESEGNRLADYSHLKVIILGKAFLEDADAMEEFLDLLEEKSEIPRNTYIVTAENAGAIIKLSDGMEESVGTYLEQLFEDISEVDKKAYPTLGMLYQEQENRTENLLIPFLVEANGKPAVDHFYVWKRGQAAGEVDNETAQLAFFTENQMESYTLLLKDGHYVRLFEPHNEIAFMEDGGRKIVADIRCSGEVLHEKKKDSVAGVETQIEEYMNRTALGALSDLHIDISNSYKKVGGYRRDWYPEYVKNSAAYETDMDIVYNVQITWVNR